MKFLLLNTDYPAFLRWLYAQHPRLEKTHYKEQMQARVESLFGVADFYSSNLRKLGHEAWDIHANNEVMQRAWGKEHGLKLSPDSGWRFRLRRGIVPWVKRVRGGKWFYEILAAQIEHYKPDVLLNHDLGAIGTRFLREIRPSVRVIVGQHAATPLPEGLDWGVYDMIVSSFPPTVEWFRARHVSAELNRLGFELSLLDSLGKAEKDIPVSFVGSFSGRVHRPRTELLEFLSESVPLRVWGPSQTDGWGDSPLAGAYQGLAWGRDMYRVLQRSKLTINHHGDVPAYANNCRLYEATGVGTCLVTDWKENLHEIFEPGKQVVAYRTPEECAELIQHYLEHEDEREAIARSGQQRTLREHTYYQRMEELVEIVGKYL